MSPAGGEGSPEPTILGLARLGHGLRRPECVRPTHDGGLCASDGRGGVTLLRPGGGQVLQLGRTDDLSEPLVPNGILPEPDGSFLVAHLGEATGGIFRLGADGSLVPLVREVDGLALPPTNYVTRDGFGRLWITVSTVVTPRHHDYRPDACTGYVACVDGRGARIVAAGLAYANECAFSHDGTWLYVSETFARRLSRFAVLAGGRLGARETVAEFGAGDFPDGLHVDADGGVWVACIVGNRLLSVAPSGAVTTHVDGADTDFIDAVEAEYRVGLMSRKNMYRVGRSPLGNISSVTARPGDPRTLYLGSLLGDGILAYGRR